MYLQAVLSTPRLGEQGSRFSITNISANSKPKSERLERQCKASMRIQFMQKTPENPPYCHVPLKQFPYNLQYRICISRKCFSEWGDKDKLGFVTSWMVLVQRPASMGPMSTCCRRTTFWIVSTTCPADPWRFWTTTLSSLFQVTFNSQFSFQLCVATT